MIGRILLCIGCLIVALCDAAAQQAPADLSGLIGAWEVVAVKLRPGRVQALRENDPEYMGAILDISQERMQWRPHQGGTLDEVCSSPRLVGESIKCLGRFGPPGVTMTVSGSRLTFLWYDNGNLILQRAR